jgi:hypothetical protein
MSQNDGREKLPFRGLSAANLGAQILQEIASAE